MSSRTRNRITKIADLLQAFADGLLTAIEVVISDHAGKRPRRSHRIITRRVYRRTPRPIVYRPVVVKIFKVKE